MTTSKWFGVAIIAVVLIVIAFLIGQNSNNQNQTASSSDNTNQQTTAAPTQPQNVSSQRTVSTTNTPKSLSDIVTEWRKSAADIECEWGNSNLGNYLSVSGSGLLVTLNSQPTVITNRHVVDYPASGSFDGCTIKFPDDSWSYFISAQDSSRNISYDTNNYDVAYLTFPADQTQYMTQDVKYGFYALTLDTRARNNDYLCSNSLAIGDPVVIIGYPAYGGSNAIFNANGNGDNSTPVEVTATEGIISGKSGIYYTTSAKIDSGNSGGLAIDETNDCYFGIPTWDESGNFESLGRILPASTFLHY
jgi:hypothetical protein